MTACTPQPARDGAAVAPVRCAPTAADRSRTPIAADCVRAGLRPLAVIQSVPRAIVWLCLAGLAASVQAQPTARFLTAGDLYRRLVDPQPEAREAARHYIMGVVDGLSLARDPRSCVGPNASTAELVALVSQQLQSRPDLHRYNAASVVREAIAVQFPCV